jgi:hypothetical protein
MKRSAEAGPTVVDRKVPPMRSKKSRNLDRSSLDGSERTSTLSFECLRRDSIEVFSPLIKSVDHSQLGLPAERPGPSRLRLSPSLSKW